MNWNVKYCIYWMIQPSFQIAISVNINHEHFPMRGGQWWTAAVGLVTIQEVSNKRTFLSLTSSVACGDSPVCAWNTPGWSADLGLWVFTFRSSSYGSEKENKANDKEILHPPLEINVLIPFPLISQSSDWSEVYANTSHHLRLKSNSTYPLRFFLHYSTCEQICERRGTLTAPPTGDRKLPALSYLSWSFAHWSELVKI